MQKSKIETGVRLAAGIIFMLTGAFKLFLARSEFEALLAWASIPFPLVFSYLIPLLELFGGAAICAHKEKSRDTIVRTRTFAALLAYNMGTALAMVGLPGLQGRVFQARGHIIGNEPWRLPLEVSLLVICLWLALRSDPDLAGA